MKTLTLYTKPECHLCHEAERVLRALQQEIPFELVLQDITEDQELFEKYHDAIPVVLCDGRELCRYHVDAERVRCALTS